MYAHVITEASQVRRLWLLFLQLLARVHKPGAGASDTFKPQLSYVNRLWREFEPLNDIANQGWLQNTSLLKDTSVLFKLRENCHAR